MKQLLALTLLAGLAACACRDKRQMPAVAAPVKEAEIPAKSEMRFDVGNGAVKFFKAPAEADADFGAQYAYGPFIVVRTELGTRSFDYRKELRSWDWSGVHFDDRAGHIWGILEYTVAGPGEVIVVLASFDNGLTWQRLKDVPKPHHTASYRGFRVMPDGRSIEVTMAVEADSAPQLKGPKGKREWLYTAVATDLGRGGWKLDSTAKP